jgi:hypothetical protein
MSREKRPAKFRNSGSKMFCAPINARYPDIERGVHAGRLPPVHYTVDRLFINGEIDVQPFIECQRNNYLMLFVN